MSISAGRLNQKISIKRSAFIQTNSGGATNTESVLVDTFAEVIEKSSRDVLNSSQEGIENFIEILIRYRPNLVIKNGDVIVWRGFEYTINNILIDPRRTYIKFIVVSNMNTSLR